MERSCVAFVFALAWAAEINWRCAMVDLMCDFVTANARAMLSAGGDFGAPSWKCHPEQPEA